MSKHFQDKEFACKCCGVDKHSIALENALEKLREKLNAKYSAQCGRELSIIITSGYRCPKHNAETPNAAKNSNHMKGTAADIVVKGLTPLQVAKVAYQVDAFKRSGIIYYDAGWVHVDVDRIIKYHAHQPAKGKAIQVDLSR